MGDATGRTDAPVASASERACLDATSRDLMLDVLAANSEAIPLEAKGLARLLADVSSKAAVRSAALRPPELVAAVR